MIMLLAAAFASCEKPSLESSTDIELIPEAGYIRFSTGVATKAPIIENLRGSQFGVFGYSYSLSSDWATARPLAKPNVFHKLEVNCDVNGVCTYDNDPRTPDTDDLEQWSLGSKYSFFAYFPMTTAVTVTDQNTVDAPRITYNLPLGTSPIDPDNLIDLMTAYSIDQTAKGSGQVDFTFQHRLFCISVLAQNFNNDVEEDGNVTTEADQTISDLKLTITNLKYTALTVPMQKGDGKIDPVYTPKSVDSDQKPVPFSATFDLSSSGSQTITVPSHDDYTGKTLLSGEKNVMLVPQNATDNPLTGSVSFKLADGTEKICTFTSRLNFQEGKKYNIVISFTGDTVIVSVAEAGAWEPHPVQFEFE